MYQLRDQSTETTHRSGGSYAIIYLKHQQIITETERAILGTYRGTKQQHPCQCHCERDNAVISAFCHRTCARVRHHTCKQATWSGKRHAQPKCHPRLTPTTSGEGHSPHDHHTDSTKGFFSQSVDTMAPRTNTATDTPHNHACKYPHSANLTLRLHHSSSAQHCTDADCDGAL